MEAGRALEQGRRAA